MRSLSSMAIRKEHLDHDPLFSRWSSYGLESGPAQEEGECLVRRPLSLLLALALLVPLLAHGQRNQAHRALQRPLLALLRQSGTRPRPIGLLASPPTSASVSTSPRSHMRMAAMVWTTTSTVPPTSTTAATTAPTSTTPPTAPPTTVPTTMMAVETTMAPVVTLTTQPIVSTTSVSDATSTNTPDWACIRWKESGDNYQASGEEYLGGAYQISAQAWQVQLGYAGYPAEAPPALQDQAALQLWNWSLRVWGDPWHPWQTAPLCGL